MASFEFEQQIDIFNLDVLEKRNITDRKKLNKERNKKAKKRLYHTLKISNILEKRCGSCKYNNTSSSRMNEKCYSCPFYKEIRENAKGLEETTKDKIHKENWIESPAHKSDHYKERLYKYQTLHELEKDIEPKTIRDLREVYSLVNIAEMLDCNYTVMKCFVNKYKLNKRLDGSYYEKKPRKL